MSAICEFADATTAALQRMSPSTGRTAALHRVGQWPVWADGSYGKNGRVGTIQGRKDDGSDTIWLDGRATDLRDAVGTSLRDAGFKAVPNGSLPGIHEFNICHRTRSGEGVLLERPRSLRRKLATKPSVLEEFCLAIRSTIQSVSVR